MERATDWLFNHPDDGGDDMQVDTKPAAVVKDPKQGLIDGPGSM